MQVALNFDFKKAALAFVLADAAAFTWLISGMTSNSLFVMTALASCAFLCVLMHYFFNGFNGGRNIFKNAFFWCGLALLILTGVQALNPSARMVQYNGYYSIVPLDYIRFLPSSYADDFENGNALWSLVVIFCVLMFSSSAYVVFDRPVYAKVAMFFFGLNCALMSAFGLWQNFSGIKAVYGLYISEGDFFGTFFLSNAATAFLNLGLACLLALAFELYAKRFYIGKLAYYTSACVIGSGTVAIFAGVLFSKSRGGMVISLLIFAVAGFVAVGKFIYARFGTRVVVGVIIFLSLSAGATAWFGSGYVLSKILHQPTFSHEFEKSFDSRLGINTVTISIIKESPFLWGSGAGSYKFVSIKKFVAGQNDKAGAMVSFSHAHNDLFEYVVEYGLAGILLIFIGGAQLLYMSFASGLSSSKFVLLGGGALIFLHSCFDIHMHITSTIGAFALIAVLCTCPLRLKRFDD